MPYFTRRLSRPVPFCLLTFLLLTILGVLTATQSESPPLPTKEFVSKTFKELNPEYWHSGDTFSLRVHIKNGTRSQHFRLHGINAPEPDDTREAELMQDSARFRLPREDILKWGNQAAATVRRILANGGVIHTKRMPAPSVLDRKYSYAVVYDAQGRDLSQLLVEAGLAAFDPNAFPLQPAELQRSQELAMRSGRGIWSHSREAVPALPIPAPSPQLAVKGDPLPKLPNQPWIVQTDGVFAPDYYTADGDSFAIKSRSMTANRFLTQVWRLYGVDCPESDMQIPERVREQANYFGVDPATVNTWGKKASRFTMQFLNSGPITIFTLQENARGVTAKTRYYAIVRVNQRDLALALIREGFARSGSMPLPGRSAEARSYRRMLDQAEMEARKAKHGIWSYSRTP